MTIVGEAFIEVKPDAAGFGPAAEKGILRDVGAIAKKAAKVFAAAFAAQKTVDFFKGAVSGASDLEESLGKVGVVFGEQAAKVQEFAANSSTAFGLSKAAALEASGTYGNLLRSIGLTEEASAEYSTTLVGLGADLASFNNTTVDEALQALRSGLVGETEPLKRFGVNMNEAALKAKALELGLYDGVGALDAQTKAQAAYQLILEQTQLAQGDFERTSGGLANQQRILAAQWEDIQAKVGLKVLPAVTALAKFTNDVLLPGLERLGSALQFNVGQAFDYVRDVVEQLGQGNPLRSLAVEFGKIIGVAEDHPLVTALGDAFVAVGDTVGGVVNSIRGVATTVVDAIAGVVGPVIAEARDAWIEYRDEGVGPIADVVDGVSDALSEVNDFLAEQRDILIPAAAAAATFAAAFVTYTQAAAAITAVSKGLTILQGAISAIGLAITASPVALLVAAIAALGVGAYLAYQNIEPFREAVDATARVIRDVAVDAFELGRDAVSELADAFDGVAGPVQAAADGVTGAVSDIPGALSGVAQGAIDALEPLTTWVDENLISTFAAAIGFFDAVADRLVGVLTPIAQVWIAQGELIIGVVREGIVAAFRVLAPAVEGSLGVVAAVLSTIAEVAIPAFLLAFDTVASVVTNVFIVVRETVEGALSVVRGLFQVFEGVLRGDWGKIWEGLGNIVLGPLESVRDIVTGVFGEVLDYLGGLPDHVADIVGELWEGLLDITGEVLEAWKETIAETVEAVLGFFEELPGLLADYFKDLAKVVGNVAKAVVSAFTKGLADLGKVVGPIADAMTAAFRAVSGVVTGTLSAAFQLARGVITGALDAIGSALQFVVSGGFDLFTGAVERLGSIVDTVITGIVDAFSGIGDALVAPFQGVAGLVAGVADEIVGTVLGLTGRIDDAAGTIWNFLVDLTTTTLTGWRDTISGIVDEVVDFFAKLPGRIGALLGDILGAGKDIAASMVDGIVQGFGGLAEQAGEFAGAVASALKDLINREVIDRINNTLEFSVSTGALGKLPGIPGSINFDPPDIPRLASGGIALAQPGGVFANIAEGGQNEAVLPLPPGVLEGLRAIAAGGGTGPGTVIEAGAIQVFGQNTPPQSIAHEVVDLLGWQLTVRNNG